MRISRPMCISVKYVSQYSMNGATGGPDPKIFVANPLLSPQIGAVIIHLLNASVESVQFFVDKMLYW